MPREGLTQQDLWPEETLSYELSALITIRLLPMPFTTTRSAFQHTDCCVNRSPKTLKWGRAHRALTTRASLDDSTYFSCSSVKRWTKYRPSCQVNNGPLNSKVQAHQLFHWWWCPAVNLCSHKACCKLPRVIWVLEAHLRRESPCSVV